MTATDPRSDPTPGQPGAVADVDLPEAVSTDRPAGVFGTAVFVVGSMGLLVAAATDALAVLGRHVGISLVGSIEVVQLAVVLIASAAIVGATLLGAHASVHLFTSRLAPATAARLDRVTSLLGALALALVAAGSIWMVSDLWHGFERTELLALPIRPFRLIWIGAAVTAAGLFIARAVRRAAA